MGTGRPGRRTMPFNFNSAIKLVVRPERPGDKCQRLSRHFKSQSWLYEVVRRIELLASKRRDGFVFERESRMRARINRKDKKAMSKNTLMSILRFLRAKGLISELTVHPVSHHKGFYVRRHSDLTRTNEQGHCELGLPEGLLWDYRGVTSRLPQGLPSGLPLNDFGSTS